MQGLVHVSVQFEPRVLKPPLYQSPDLDLLERERESGGVRAEPTEVTPPGVVSERGGVAGILVTARAGEPWISPLHRDILK